MANFLLCKLLKLCVTSNILHLVQKTQSEVFNYFFFYLCLTLGGVCKRKYAVEN